MSLNTWQLIFRQDSQPLTALAKKDKQGPGDTQPSMQVQEPTPASPPPPTSNASTPASSPDRRPATSSTKVPSDNDSHYSDTEDGAETDDEDAEQQKKAEKPVTEAERKALQRKREKR